MATKNRDAMNKLHHSARNQPSVPASFNEDPIVKEGIHPEKATAIRATSRRVHASTNFPSTAKTSNIGTHFSSSVDPKIDKPLNSAKHGQQSRDLLFGEDSEPSQGIGRVQLNKAELESRSVEELQSYAILQSQDVSQNIADCKRIVGETTSLASSTMEMLHEQGGQITRSHLSAVRVQNELTVGEKVLGSLGGLFSRRWKPKKGAKITGPQEIPDVYKRKTGKQERAAMLGQRIDADSGNRARARAKDYTGLPAAQVQLEMERDHQDEGLSDLGDMVSQLKNMTRDMHEEVERQTISLGHVEHDLDAIGNRVKQAYNRTRYLVSR